MKYFRCVVFIVILVLSLFSCSKVQSKGQQSDLKEFKASEIIRMIEKGKSVTIVNAIIYDDLDFTTVDEGKVVSPTQLSVEIVQPIYFQSCVFLGKVSANGNISSKGSKIMMKKFTHFRSDVCFYDCDFRKELVFDESIVDGNMNFAKTIFTDVASFNHMLVNGTQCFFANIQAKSSFQFIYSTIRGDVNFMDARFSGSFSASSLVAKDLVMNNVQVEGRMNLSEMLLSGIFMFNYGHCANDVSFAFSIDKVSPGTKAFSLSIKIFIASSQALMKSVDSNIILFSWKFLEFKLSTIDLYIFEIKFKLSLVKLN